MAALSPNGLLDINIEPNQSCIFIGDLHTDAQLFIRFLEQESVIRLKNNLDNIMQQFGNLVNSAESPDTFIDQLNKLVHGNFEFLPYNDVIVLLGDIFDGRRGGQEIELFSEFLILHLIYCVGNDKIHWLVGNHCLFSYFDDIYLENINSTLLDVPIFRKLHQAIAKHYFNILQPSVVARVNNAIVASHILIHDAITYNQLPPEKALAAHWNSALNAIYSEEKIDPNIINEFGQYDIRINEKIQPTFTWLNRYKLHLSAHTVLPNISCYSAVGSDLITAQPHTPIYCGIDMGMSRVFSFIFGKDDTRQIGYVKFTSSGGTSGKVEILEWTVPAKEDYIGELSTYKHCINPFIQDITQIQPIVESPVIKQRGRFSITTIGGNKWSHFILH